MVSVLVLAAGLDAAALQAQSFQGAGQQATDLFSLNAGLAIFEVEHRGTGAFAVRLLSEHGSVVEEIARGVGPFQGSKAVSIPQGGRFLFDVSATGPWSVRRREGVSATTEAPVMPDTASPTYKAAVAAADEVGTGGWFVRGVIGGALAGPIGAGIVVGFAGRSRVQGPAASDGGGNDHEPGYNEAFAARVRQERKKKAFVGGMVGSGIFIAGLIWAVDIAGGGEGGAPGGEPPPGGVFATIPR